MTVVIVYGPKGAGKSQVTDVLRVEHGIAHVDADAIVLDLMAQGVRPHPEHGWLAQVEAAVLSVLQDRPTVSVEATGAWSSDGELADDLKAAGHQVVCIWVFAPLDVTLRRLARRSTVKAPVTAEEARRIWTTACSRAEGRHFDLVLDTTMLGPEDLPGLLAPLATTAVRST